MLKNEIPKAGVSPAEWSKRSIARHIILFPITIKKLSLVFIYRPKFFHLYVAIQPFCCCFFKFFNFIFYFKVLKESILLRLNIFVDISAFFFFFWLRLGILLYLHLWFMVRCLVDVGTCVLLLYVFYQTNGGSTRPNMHPK